MKYLKIIGLWLVVAAMAGLVACEKAVMDDDDMEQPEKQGNVVIRTSTARPSVSCSTRTAAR